MAKAGLVKSERLQGAGLISLNPCRTELVLLSARAPCLNGTRAKTRKIAAKSASAGLGPEILNRP